MGLPNSGVNQAKTLEEQYLEGMRSLPEDVMKYIPNEGQTEGNNYQRAFYQSHDLAQDFHVIMRFLYDKYRNKKVFKDFYVTAVKVANIFNLYLGDDDILSCNIFSNEDNSFLSFFDIIAEEGNGEEYLDADLIVQVNNWWAEGSINDNDVCTYSPKLRQRIEFIRS